MARLADMIIQKAHDGVGQGRFYRTFADALAQAIPFEFSDDFGFMIGQIEKTGLKKIIPATKFAKTPFRRVWFEWSGSSRIFCGNAIPSRKDEMRAEAPPPMKMGCLIETDDTMSRCVMHFAWCHGDGLVNICPLSSTFDYSDSPRECEDIGRDRNKATPEVIASIWRNTTRWCDGCTEDEIFREFLHSGLIENQYMRGLLDNISATPVVGSKMIYKVMSDALADIEGEPRFIRCALIAINAKNLARVDNKQDMGRANLKRIACGKPPLLSFSTVRLSLTKASIRKIGAVSNRSNFRVHIVMGHFKTRKTGVFWWMPFARGDKKIGVVQRAGYEVSPHGEESDEE